MNHHDCPSVEYESTSHSGILTRWLIGWGDKPAIFELVFEGSTFCCSFSDQKFFCFLFTLTLAVYSLTAPVLEQTEKLRNLPESRLFPPSVCQDRLCNNIAPPPHLGTCPVQL